MYAQKLKSIHFSHTQGCTNLLLYCRRCFNSCRLVIRWSTLILKVGYGARVEKCFKRIGSGYKEILVLKKILYYCKRVVFGL